jgi:hypothetical protein
VPTDGGELKTDPKRTKQNRDVDEVCGKG